MAAKIVFLIKLIKRLFFKQRCSFKNNLNLILKLPITQIFSWNERFVTYDRMIRILYDDRATFDSISQQHLSWNISIYPINVSSRKNPIPVFFFFESHLRTYIHPSFHCEIPLLIIIMN